MPSRILRDGILTSVPINALSPEAELFYRRLQSVVDDYGRYYSNPALVRAACYPLQLKRVSEDDVVRWLLECTKQIHKDTKQPLILVYQTDGKDCLQITKFKQQEKTKPKFPAPPQLVTEPLTDRARAVHEPVHLVGGEVVVECGCEVGVGVVSTLASQGGENRSVSTPACPHEKIIAAYHEHLPMGRQVNPKVWNGQRKQHLQARWREDKERQHVEWWSKFFGYCAKSAFLTGKVQPRQGRSAFQVSLDWIISPSNFAKIIEGAYER